MNIDLLQENDQPKKKKKKTRKNNSKTKNVNFFLTNNALLVDLPQLWCLQARVKRAFGKKVELLKKSSALGLAARRNYSSLAGSVVSAAATICRYRFFPTYNDTLPRERGKKQ